MQVEGKESRVFKSSWTRRNKNERRKGEDGIGLANSQWSQGYSKVF